MRIAFSAATVASAPYCPASQTSEQVAQKLQSILKPTDNNPFDVVSKPVGVRVRNLNPRISFQVLPKDAEHVEVQLRHAGFVQDVMMRQSVDTPVATAWLDKIEAVRDIAPLRVVRQLNNQLLATLNPVSESVNRLRRDILKDPVFQKSLLPLLDRARDLSVRQNKLDSTYAKAYARAQHSQDEMIKSRGSIDLKDNTNFRGL